jgi:hypothetical protein
MNLFARLRRHRQQRADRHPMHVCVVCRANAVTPLHTQVWDDDRWLVVLRCGACGHERTGLFAHATCLVYEGHLDASAHLIRRSLKAAEAERERSEMAEGAERFIEALKADIVGPDDFAERRAA